MNNKKNQFSKSQKYSKLVLVLIVLMCKKSDDKLSVEDIIFKNLNSGGEAQALELKFQKDGSYTTAFRSPGIWWYNVSAKTTAPILKETLPIYLGAWKNKL